MIDLNSYQEEGLLRRPPKSFHPSREEIKIIEDNELQVALLKQLEGLEELNQIGIGVLRHSTKTAIAMATFPLVGVMVDAIVEKLATGNVALTLSSSRISSLGAAVAVEGMGAMTSGAIKVYANMRKRSFAKKVWRHMDPEARIKHIPAIVGNQLPKPS